MLKHGRRPWEEVFLVIGSAVVVSVLLDALINPPDSWVKFAGRLAGSGVRILIAVLVGMYLGKYAWPRRGRALGFRILKRTINGKVKPLLLMTDRPDFRPSMPRRIFEVVGFVAGTTIILTAALALAGVTNLGVSVPSQLYTLLALYAAFLLVPYWTFSRMGLRRVDPVRWTVEPLSRRYASRLRLSNGALLLIALGVSINLALRAGATGDAALIASLQLLGHLVAAILVTAASAVAYYSRAEKEVFLALEDEAVKLGIHDGRDMSDGDFLPRGL